MIQSLSLANIEEIDVSPVAAAFGVELQHVILVDGDEIRVVCGR